MSTDALSALLDGECGDAELDRLLDELGRSPELGSRWSRLCATREAGSGTRILDQQPCICAGVMAALDEPAAAGSKVVDLAVHRAAVKPRPAVLPSVRRYWKPALGFAAAASMGAAAVLLVQPQAGLSDPVPGLEATSTSQPAAYGGRLHSARYEPGSAEQVHAEMLRDYLIDHSNSISGEGVGGTLRYARFAAHTAEYRTQADEQP